MLFKLNMWIRQLPIMLAAALIGALYGCSSAPIHYYTLVPLKGTQPGSSVSPIVIDRVSLPPQVDRSQIVVRDGSIGLVVLETQWWGASLTDELQNALANQLPKVDSSRPERTPLHLTLDIQRFDSVPGQYALIEAKWRLRNRESNVRIECYSRLSTPSGNTVDALVTAHQTNITQLSLLIAAAARNGKC